MIRRTYITSTCQLCFLACSNFDGICVHVVQNLLCLRPLQLHLSIFSGLLFGCGVEESDYFGEEGCVSKGSKEDVGVVEVGCVVAVSQHAAAKGR